MAKPEDQKPEKAPKGEKPPKGEKAPKPEGGEKAEKPGRGPKPGGEGEEHPEAKKARLAKAKADAEKARLDAEKAKRDAKAAEKKPSEPAPPARLYEYYKTVVRPGLRKHFNYPNDNATPKITKVVLNMGVGEARENPKMLEALAGDMSTIAGQKAQITKAKTSIANFKLRQGMAIGCKVTLRRQRMYEFLDRLTSIAVPRIRDFRGLSPKAFDGRGNYSLGLTEQIVFPEIQSDKVEFFNGMNVVVCTTAKTDNEARELLRLMGFPFRGLEVAGFNITNVVNRS